MSWIKLFYVYAYLETNLTLSLSSTCGFVDSDIDQVDKEANAQNPKWRNCE